MNYKTEKLYYTTPDLLQNHTNWQKVEGGNEIAVQASCAFPEGGGQLGDQGYISQNGISIPFVDAQKYGFGRQIVRQDFPLITVDQEIRLKLERAIPEDWQQEHPITISVDAERRRKLSLSHVAAHLLWLALTEQFGNLYPVVRGCYIAPTHGRFDLLIEKPCEEQLLRAQTFIDEWVAGKYQIEMRNIPNEQECRIWHCQGRDIPCGGTHLESTGLVGNLTLRTKSKGKSGQRIIYEISTFSQ